MLKSLLEKILLRNDGTVSKGKAGATTAVALVLVGLLASYVKERYNLEITAKDQEILAGAVVIALSISMVGIRDAIGRMSTRQKRNDAQTENIEKRVIEVAKAVEAPPPPLPPLPPKAG